MIFTLVYLAATLLYPLRETYRLLRGGSEAPAQQLWAVYWGVFSVILVLKRVLPFLSIKAVEAVILLLCVWLYHSEYRGALYLRKRATDFLNGNQIAQALLASVKEWNAFLNIVEDKKRE